VDLLLLLATAIGGTALTFLVPLALPALARLAAGFCVGSALLGLLALVLASTVGLNPAAAIIAVLLFLMMLPALAVALRPGPRGRAREAWAALRAELEEARRRPAAALLTAVPALAVAALLIRVFALACFVDERGLQTSDGHNLGDLPFHLAVIQGFARGENFPPQHPELAGARLTYPFLVDLDVALLVRAGATPVRALFEHNVLLALALAVLIAHFARRLSGDRLAALLTLPLVFLSGGLGFLLLVTDADPLNGGIWALLPQLPFDYTMREAPRLRFGNALSTMLVTQRSLLLGASLFLVAASLFWDGIGAPSEAEAKHALGAAGVAVALMPLVHGHAFVTVLAVGTALAALFRRRAWMDFLVLAVAGALPQVAWMATGSSMQLRRFVAWQPGWDHGGANPVSFWLWNTGVFVPLLLAALLWWRGGPVVGGRLARFYIPFACCFVVPNLFRLSPWIWDNAKFLFLWWLASAPLVAMMLARLLRGRALSRLAGLGLLFVATASGALDVWRLARPVRTYPIFSPAALDLGETLAATTPLHAIVLHAPEYDSPVPLSGRRSLLGYDGHIWSQGLDGQGRADKIKQVYEGGEGAAALAHALGVDFVLVGPQEYQRYAVNDDFLDRWPVVFDTPPYRLHAVK
jgi:hypothetical protein